MSAPEWKTDEAGLSSTMTFESGFQLAAYSDGRWHIVLFQEVIARGSVDSRMDPTFKLGVAQRRAEWTFRIHQGALDLVDPRGVFGPTHTQTVAAFTAGDDPHNVCALVEKLWVR